MSRGGELAEVGLSAIVMHERPRRSLVWVVIPALLGTYLLSFGTMSPSQAFSGAQGRAEYFTARPVPN